MSHDAHHPRSTPPPSTTPAPVAPPQPIREETGALGAVTVVPDDFAGAMPFNGVRESDYSRMTAVYGNIDSGNSQLRIDTSSFFADPTTAQPISLVDSPLQYLRAMGQAAEFRSEYLGYMANLVKTPAGLQLLEELDGSKHSTTLAPGPSNVTTTPTLREFEDGHRWVDGTVGPGADALVYMNSADKTWDADSETCATSKQIEPWMERRPEFGFYHELVHAYHLTRGDQAPMGFNHATCSDIPYGIGNAEWQASGLGPWAADPVSENAIRAQMGAPLRPTYGGSRYDGPDPFPDVPASTP
jgi:hypothetical protein